MKHGENTTVECPIDPWHDGGVRGVRLDSRPGLIPWELHYFHLANDGYYLVSILKLEKHETSILLSSHDICSAFRRSRPLGKINAGTRHVMTCTTDFSFVKPNEKVSSFTTFWYLRVRKHIVAISQWFVTMAWCGHPEPFNMVKQRQQSHFANDWIGKDDDLTLFVDMRGSIIWMDWGVTLSGYRETKPIPNDRGKFQVNEIGTPST